MDERRPPPFTVVRGGGKRRSKYEETPRQKYERRRRDHENAIAALRRIDRVLAQLRRFEEGAREVYRLVAPVERRGWAEQVALHWHVQSLVDELRACLFQFHGLAEQTWDATNPAREGEER